MRYRPVQATSVPDGLSWDVNRGQFIEIAYAGEPVWDGEKYRREWLRIEDPALPATNPRRVAYGQMRPGGRPRMANVRKPHRPELVRLGEQAARETP